MSKVVININISITINENDKESSKDNQVSGKTQTPESTMTMSKNGVKGWHNADGKLHRDDGPAIEHPNGYKAWYIDGNLHRTDGPAVVCARGSKEWFINGKQLTEKEFMAATAALKPTI